MSTSFFLFKKTILFFAQIIILSKYIYISLVNCIFLLQLLEIYLTLYIITRIDILILQNTINVY